MFFYIAKLEKSYLERYISTTTSTRTTRTSNSKQPRIMSILNLKFHIATTSTWHFTDFPNHLFFMFDFHQLSPIRITSSTTAVLASKRSIKVQKDLSLSILKSHFEVSTIATIHSGATIRFFFHDKKYSSILIKHIISIFVFPPTSNFQKPKLKCLKITQKVSFYNIASDQWMGTKIQIFGKMEMFAILAWKFKWYVTLLDLDAQSLHSNKTTCPNQANYLDFSLLCWSHLRVAVWSVCPCCWNWSGIPGILRGTQGSSVQNEPSVDKWTIERIIWAVKSGVGHKRIPTLLLKNFLQDKCAQHRC